MTPPDETARAPVRFEVLEAEAPEVAEGFRRRVTDAGVALLGTVRADGGPRVSPVEITLAEGGIYMGAMPGSMKLRDLERDPRCCLLTPVADRDDLGGEGKVYGVVRRLEPADARRMLAVMLPDDAGDMGDPPIFEVLVASAAWQLVEDDIWVTWSWNPTSGVRHRRRKGNDGEPRDVGTRG